MRLNPGLGSGGTNRTNTGGPASSFGIWHEYLPDVQRIAAQYDLTIDRIHSHIGSGSDPEVWKRVTRMTLDLVEQFPDATRGQPGRRLQGRAGCRARSRPTCRTSGTTSSAS